MKILRILLRNLHSVRSEVEIDFTESPLSDTGLFAITGDTGAGKTTILDAITLAMYGDICRKAAPVDALSYGAEEGLAECEFEAKGRTFLTQWRVKTTRSKDPNKRLKTERSVAERDEKTGEFHIIAERKVREVNALIEEVTGLDFPRFTRSVLLAQGDFAAFLKANEKERSDLLERITGTEVYSELSKAALARRNIEQDELAKLTTQREALHLLSSTEIKEKKQELREAKRADKANAESLKSVQSQLSVLEKISALGKEKEKLEKEKEAISEESEKLRPNLKRLALHKKTAPLRPDLERLADREEEAEKLKSEIGELTVEKENLNAQKTASDEILAKAKSDFDELRKSQKSAFKLFDEVAALDEKIKAKNEQFAKQKRVLDETRVQVQTIENQFIEIKKELGEGSEKEKEFSQWLNENQSAEALSKELPLVHKFRETLRDIFSSKSVFEKNIASQKTKLEEVEKAIENLDKKCEAEQKKLETALHEFEQKTPDEHSSSRHELLENLGREIESAGGSHNNLRQLHELNEAYSRLLSEANEMEAQLDNLRSHELALDMELLTIVEACEEAEKKVKFKREIYRQQLLVANFEQARAELKEGEECPVCLSTEHPFRAQKIEPFVDEAKAEMEAAESRFSSYQKKRNALIKEHTDIAAAIHRIDSATTGELGKINAQALEIERKMAALSPHFEAEDFGLSHGDFLRKKLENFESDLSAKKELRTLLATLHAEILELEKSVAKLADERKDLEIKRVSLRENLQANRDNFAEQKKKFERTSEELNEIVGKYGFRFSPDTGREMFDDLERRESTFSEKKKEADELAKRIALLSQKLEQTEARKKELSEKSTSLFDEFSVEEKAFNQLKNSRLEKFGKKSPEAERELFLKKMEEAEERFSEEKNKNEELKSSLKVVEKTEKDRKASLEKSDEIIQKLKATLSKKATDFGFAELSELRGSLLPEEESERIEKRHENLRKRQIETEQSERNWQKEWEKANKNLLPEKPLDELKSELEILGKSNREIQQKIGAIQQQLADNEKRGEEAKRLLDDIDRQRTVFNRWNDLYDLIGSSDGKKFRIFAQGLTLQKLVQLANVHLADLHGRYFIVKRPGEDLELDIVDTYQAENIRSMHTLSGGESFLVSLALALGLSDLAGRNANIRSLFIDEGFGTLDDQALDVAITTLENLQSSGKTIGVISHVKELKERISTQVRLVKKGGGVSEVEII